MKEIGLSIEQALRILRKPNGGAAVPRLADWCSRNGVSDEARKELESIVLQAEPRTPQDVAFLAKMIRESGALELARENASRLANRAREGLRDAFGAANREPLHFLHQVATWSLERRS